MRAVVILAILLAISIAGIAHADFNSKAVDDITLKITKAGQLQIEGSVQRANLTLYVPQEGIQNLDITSNEDMQWRYSNDTLGNKVIILGWPSPYGIVNYKAEITVKNSAKYVNPSSEIGYDKKYLGQSDSIIITDDIRKAAYPYEKTWDNVARLTEFVYNYVTYDITLLNAREDSQWTYENKRGVCVEHANLLTALLRASGIPARYVVGYAYSNMEKKLIGHTWVEVLASDGSWIPFDPTWLEGGYIDATHIKTGNLLDDNQTETLTYFGSGKIIPISDDQQSLYTDSVDILDYTVKNVTAIALSGKDVPIGGYGYVKADISSLTCAINQMGIQPCVDEHGGSVFEVYEKDRNFFSCGAKAVYWFYKELDGKNAYSCPVTVYDQVGSSEDKNIKAVRLPVTGRVLISGPDVVATNELFTLRGIASSDFVFYSPDFDENKAKDWALSISRPGSYVFYLYSEGSLAKKTINVVDKKEFNLSVQAPASVKEGDSFLINITAKNIGFSKTVRLAVDFDGQRQETYQTFIENEEKTIVENLTAINPGEKQLVVSIAGDTLTPYSATVFVEETIKTGGVFDFIANFFSSIANFFFSLFGR
ncbi:MAG: transglutaminase-like domain-containing protein [Candidatus Aenigmarchaeota archaeon]|nr:transglutaminase-like domain-containing protein [Candidatus Aenigmarchaeota archaeon]